MTHDYEVMRHCVIAYLHHIRSLIDSMDDIETRLARVCARLDLMGVDYTAKGLPAGSGADHGDDAVTEGIMVMQELRTELATAFAHGNDDIQHARALCGHRHTARHVLWLHYVERMGWDDVGIRVKYSSDHVKHKLVRAGILELYNLMPEQWRRNAIPNDIDRYVKQ